MGRVTRFSGSGKPRAVVAHENITERKRVEDERDRLRTQEIEARTQREERRRIARDLHDIALQDLSGALQSLRLAHLRSNGSGLGLDFKEELEALSRATSGLRSAIHDLRHEKERPFVEALESLVERERQLGPQRQTVLAIEEGLQRAALVPAEVGVELLRVVREALTNARRHSAASRVEVELRTDDGAILLLQVSDDGEGFEPARVRAGVGLSAMRERVEALGGLIEVESAPREGTKVRVRVPLRGGTPDPRRL
jgi:signal transduction histidine kinase